MIALLNLDIQKVSAPNMLKNVKCKIVKRVKRLKTLSWIRLITLPGYLWFSTNLALEFLNGLIEAVNKHLLLADIVDLLVEIPLQLLDSLELDSWQSLLPSQSAHPRHSDDQGVRFKFSELLELKQECAVNKLINTCLIHTYTGRCIWLYVTFYPSPASIFVLNPIPCVTCNTQTVCT